MNKITAPTTNLDASIHWLLNSATLQNLPRVRRQFLSFAGNSTISSSRNERACSVLDQKVNSPNHSNLHQAAVTFNWAMCLPNSMHLRKDGSNYSILPIDSLNLTIRSPRRKL